jgi:hypothetical protein
LRVPRKKSRSRLLQFCHGELDGDQVAVVRGCHRVTSVLIRETRNEGFQSASSCIRMHRHGQRRYALCRALRRRPIVGRCRGGTGEGRSSRDATKRSWRGEADDAASCRWRCGSWCCDSWCCRSHTSEVRLLSLSAVLLRVKRDGPAASKRIVRYELLAVR